MRNTNAFSFRPTVETLADRTMPSVTPIISNPVIVPTDATVKTSHATNEVVVTWTIQSIGHVQSRKAGGGQKDW